MTALKAKIKATQAPEDCLKCANCAIAIPTDGKGTPPNMKYFCIKLKRPLISRFFGEIYVNGIQNARTCPDFKFKITNNQ